MIKWKGMSDFDLDTTEAKIASLDSEVSYIKHDVEALRGDLGKLADNVTRR